MAGNAASFLCCFTRAEIDRYSEHFRISRDKFRFVPLAFQLSDVDSLVPCDGGYIFAGGNQSRDWETFLRAMDGLSYPSRVFAKMGQPHSVPPNVMLGSASRSEYHAQMASASCVIVPLLREPLRITGITAWTNAMAMGKVVIVTGRDGTSDYLEHGVSGFCVDYGDVEGLRHYVRLVMQDPELRKRVGAAARERAWRDFCPDVFRRRVLNLLQEACGHDPHISSPLYDE
jgi:glycosyltransferase involved in cell wall biosynthesis